VLFFLSLLERKIWVLADKGIYEKWIKRPLTDMQMRFLRGERGASLRCLSHAIQEVGALLSRHFPITPGDTDELPNGVMTEK